jgi:dimethylargininase
MRVDGARERAIVRGVAGTFDTCIKPHGEPQAIDLDLARRQHASYCSILEKLGLELIRLDADDQFPDCCFVEDTAVVAGDTAVICEMGASSRRGEEEAVAGVLRERRLNLRRLEPPASLDGGDVIVTGDQLFCGMSDRSNRAAAGKLDEFFLPEGLEVVPVPVIHVLHLKSACTALSPGVVLIAEQFADAEAFAGFDRIVVPAAESYAANCLSVNGTVVLSGGFPATKKLVEERGFPVETLEMTEFRKAGGSLTCLSIIL